MLPDEDLQQMKQYGFIYADGSYSDDRLPKGATLVPRRPSPHHKWDSQARRWVTTTSFAPSAPQVMELSTALAPAPAAKVGESPAVQPDYDMSPLVAGMLANTTTPEAS